MTTMTRPTVLDGFKTEADFYGTTVPLSLMVPREFRDKHPIGGGTSLAPILRAAADELEGVTEGGDVPSLAIATSGFHVRSEPVVKNEGE